MFRKLANFSLKKKRFWFCTIEYPDATNTWLGWPTNQTEKVWRSGNWFATSENE